MPACKLWVLTPGHFTVGRDLMDPGATDQVMKLPATAYLVEHRRGRLLFDTGLSRALLVRSQELGIPLGLEAELTPDEDLACQLAQVGAEAAQIKHVVLSHFHPDHVGGLRHFRGTESVVLVNQAEWARVQAQKSSGEPLYRLLGPEWDLGLSFQTLAGDHDVYGDGSVIVRHLPGHTLGFQGLQVDLPETGRVIVAGESAYRLGGRLVAPGRTADTAAARATVDMLQAEERRGVTLFLDHDPVEAFKLRRVPASYT